jgi:hypothetical protein
MGASNRYCLAAVDYPPDGSAGGFWEFGVNDQNKPEATYTDADANHPLNGDFVEFLDTECAVRKFVNGVWVAGTFADL